MNPSHNTWDAVQLLLARGLSAAEVARGLDLPEYRVLDVARFVRDDGARDQYLTDCLNRAKADPHPDECLEYLYVRGVTWEQAHRKLGVPYARSRYRPAPVGAQRRYRDTQMRLAVAGVLP